MASARRLWMYSIGAYEYEYGYDGMIWERGVYDGLA
jgi:hypothetical protein